MNCKGQNKNNTACKCTTSNKSGYCFRHLKQAPVIEDNFEPEIVKKVSTVCKGTTTRGKSPCKAKTSHESGYCPSHRNIDKIVIKPVSTVCKSKTSNGEDCKCKTIHESGYCYRHSEVKIVDNLEILADNIAKIKFIDCVYTSDDDPEDEDYVYTSDESEDEDYSDESDDEDEPVEPTCKALTKKGTACKFKVTNNGYCSKHVDKN
jgi:hypothetical protein